MTSVDALASYLLTELDGVVVSANSDAVRGGRRAAVGGARLTGGRRPRTAPHRRSGAREHLRLAVAAGTNTSPSMHVALHALA